MKLIRRIGLPYAVTLVVIFIAWKALSIMVSQDVLPAPEMVAKDFGLALVTPGFWHHFTASFLRAFAAMILGWGVAFPIGVLMGSSPRVDRFLSPFVTMTYPVPKVVMLPVVLLLFGLGNLSKVLIISLILGYQVLVATRDGVRGIPEAYLASIRSLGASRWQVFREGYLPAALPHGFTALRLNSGVSVAVLFFVESFATTEGLGYLIMDAWGQMDFGAMFVGICGMSLLGVILNEGSNLLEKLCCPWY